jgi:uncharacterized protein HemX
LNFLRNMPKEKLQKVVLAGVLALIGAATVGYFYVAKQISNIGKSKGTIEELTRKIQDAENNARQASQNQQAREQVRTFLETQRAKMEIRLPGQCARSLCWRRSIPFGL